MAGFFKSLIDAAPAFLSAVEGFEVPEDLRGVRFGVREWHHPAIVTMLDGVHPDAEAGELIEAWLSTLAGEAITGSATELFGFLDSFHYPAFGRTCRSPAALGQTFRRLAHVAGWCDRISSARVGASKQTQWTIQKAPAQALAA